MTFQQATNINMDILLSGSFSEPKLHEVISKSSNDTDILLNSPYLRGDHAPKSGSTSASTDQEDYIHDMKEISSSIMQSMHAKLQVSGI